MSIPPITSIGSALSVYYSHAELGNKEIKKLFGKLSPTTVAKLKRIVKDEMWKSGVASFGSYTVNTEVAYRVWGIDVDALERRLQKLRELQIEPVS